MKNNHKRSFELIIYTMLSDENDFGIYLNIVWETEKLLKRTVHQLYGSNHIIDFFYSSDNQQFCIKIDDNIKFNGKVSGYDYLGIEPISDKAKCMEDYEITEDELITFYKAEPELLMEPEPCMKKYKCMFSLSLADDVSDKYYDIADKILFSVIPHKI